MVNNQSISVNYTRVNGNTLNQFHGKPVCMIGTVVKADGGTAFQLKSPDNTIITIRLKEPISETLCGVIQVCGTGQGKTLIIAENFFVFNEESSANFDMGTYNDCMNLMHTTDSCPWLK